MLDDRVGTEDVRCDIERVRTIDAVIFATVKEADSASFRRFLRKL
jgi:hypothetical protein